MCHIIMCLQELNRVTALVLMSQKYSRAFLSCPGIADEEVKLCVLHYFKRKYLWIDVSKKKVITIKIEAKQPLYFF